MPFNTLNLPVSLLKALEKIAYAEPTPIQTQSIPQIIKGHDLLAEAQTGTGKTAAFALPALKFWSETNSEIPKYVHTLVLTPTRELALQVATSFKKYAQCLNPKPQIRAIIGGENPDNQINALQEGVDIVVATPGRLLDMLDQRHIALDRLALLILDEADKMLSLGFADELEVLFQIVPPQRQTLLFSATFPEKVLALTEKVLTQPVEVRIAQEEPTLDRVQQRVIQVDTGKRGLLLRHLIGTKNWQQTVVFVSSKRGARNLASKLQKANIKAVAFHGGLDQMERVDVLRTFKKKRAQVLVATDIAARGLDFEDISHVINFDLPRAPADYIHRIGRTARAGRDGVAISFVSADTEAHFQLIEKRAAIQLEREIIAGFEPVEKASPKKAYGPIKGKRKSKKDKLREAASKALEPS